MLFCSILTGDAYVNVFILVVVEIHCYW